MSMTSRLVLADDVVLVPTAELPEALRERVGGEAGDYAISRPWSRSPSKLVDADGAALLQAFHVPTTIADAVIAFSARTGSDPEVVLSEAFPLLQRLVQARFLVEPDSPDKERIAARMNPGDRLATTEITQLLQVTEDAEVYQVRTDTGTLAVAKILRPGHQLSMGHNLAREVAILEHLEGDPSPALLAAGTFDERPYFLMEWCPGVPASAVAAELRHAGGAEMDRGLLDLGRRVLTAYAVLHGKDVVHGDIHPRNVLVGPDGTLKVIDLGLACWRGHPRHANAPRGGLSYFFEPEVASAFLRGTGPAAPSPAGEQYALAVLLFELFTGGWYLEFAAAAADMYRQIAEDEPLDFATRHVPPWPQVERILRTALCKDPAGRFADVGKMADELSGVPPRDLPAEADGNGRGGPGDRQGREFLAALLPRFGLDGPMLASDRIGPPTASVSYGRAGIALALHQMACARDDPSLLALSDVWVTSAVVRLDDDAGFGSTEFGLTPDVLGEVSTFFGPPGVHVAAAIISDARGDTESCDQATGAFMGHARAPSTNLDLTLGRSSLLMGCATLKEILDGRGVEPSALVALGNETSRAIWEILDTYPPVGRANELTYLGVAHGWAGILYATLRWSAGATTPLPSAMSERLLELAACGEEVGRGLRWPVQLAPGMTEGQRGYMPGWCNGSAGYVALWGLAHRATGDDAFATLAERSGWNSWEDGDTYPSLCCGFAGRGYALVNLYNATGDRRWLERARSLADRSIRASGSLPERLRHSLFKGDFGPAVLYVDLERPEAARFPLFESP